MCISDRRPGIPWPTGPVTAVPPQLCIHAAWLRSPSSLASMAAASGFGSLAFVNPSRRSYQYQTKEPIPPP